MAKMIRIPSAYVIDTKVVGVSHQNDDGTSRQMVIANEVQEGDQLSLSPEPTNQYDPNAVRVLTQKGRQIGYLKKDVAQKLTEAIRNQTEIRTKVSWVGEKEFKGVGLRIELVS